MAPEAYVRATRGRRARRRRPASPRGRQGWLWHGAGNPPRSSRACGPAAAFSTERVAAFSTREVRTMPLASSTPVPLAAYVSSVSDVSENVLCGCCKSRSRCYTCCNSYTRMLQASVSNVSFVFFSTYVTSVFISMLHMCSRLCCKCFI